MTKLMNQEACILDDDEDDDDAGIASADDDDDVARRASADDRAGFSSKSLKCEMTTGSDSDVGVEVM